MRVSVITSSDRCARGEAEDQSGPAIIAFCEQHGWDVVYAAVVADDLAAISDALRKSADDHAADVALTTGGTGLGPRDVTPEATLQVIDRAAPGVAEALRLESLKITPFAMLSRGVAGMRARTLIINLPGSPKAVLECMEILRPIIPHAIDMMAGGGHNQRMKDESKPRPRLSPTHPHTHTLRPKIGGSNG